MDERNTVYFLTGLMLLVLLQMLVILEFYPPDTVVRTRVIHAFTCALTRSFPYLSKQGSWLLGCAA